MSDLPGAQEENVAALRHDLRTPLNQIIGYAELVAEDLEAGGHKESRADLAKIAGAARDLAELITREIQPGRVVFLARPAASTHGESPGSETPGLPMLAAVETSPPAITAQLLIVDDSPENCTVLRRRLEREGHACGEVHDGASALALLASEPFDLVLLDIMMPGMDGREVLRRIKADPTLRHLPVIMISALDQLESVVECIELGAGDYLPKPFNPVLLRARIGSSLERKSLRDAEQAAFGALQASQAKLAGELSEAAAYVQSVLPPPLTEGPVRASWVFQPSSSLGGDAFGYGAMDGGLFGICLLDVCGHGVGAALLSISVLNVIRSESLPGVEAAEPGDMLAGLNTAFPMERHGEMFFTAWCGICHLGPRLMRFAAGGHPPAVLVRADGSTDLLVARGPVIGAMPGMKFTTGKMVIPPASRLFVFSDGAYEILRRDGTMMGHDDLRQLLAGAPRRKATEWVMEQLRGINSQPTFDDDVSLVELSFP